MRIRLASNILRRIVTLSFCVIVLQGVVAAQSLSEREMELFKWRNIGPANFQGRISDIEALDNDFSKVLVAAASGGVWKSDNAGTTWETIFDNYGSASIGDIARSQRNPDIIWVGTGEANNRNSVAWGDGIYKSEDGGKTFTNMGLKDTYQIARVIIDPKNDNTVYVAAIGNLWAHNGTRGLFKTTNGGQSWEKLTNGLPDDGKTGATDLVIDPKNPKHLYVAMYERLRQPHRFDSGGPNGGIYKSTNGGKSWKKLTNGLPDGPTGRIGLSIYRKDPKIVMAWVEHGFHPRRGQDGFDDMSRLGSGVYRTENGGKDWKYLNRLANRPFYYSQIRIDPGNDQKVYAISTYYQVSEDGGNTFTTRSPYENPPSIDIHVDHHAMWIDPTNSSRYYIGTDGGASISHDGGKTHTFLDNINVAQFYAIGVDMRDPYYVYGGLQDNGSWAGPSNSRDSYGILTNHWYKIGGGDGFHVQIDPTDWRTVYAESQAGNIFRIDPVTMQRQGLRPPNEVIGSNTDSGRRRNVMKYRYNWSAPIVLSPHNPRTIYFGANVLWKSVDQGQNWEVISPDLTTNDPNRKDQFDTGGLTNDFTGAETNTTIITVSESPITPGILWVGTDDGYVQISRNGGVNWENVTSNIPGLPEGIWTSRVDASNHQEGTAYATFDDHRRGNFAPYVYKTTDYGKSWTNITSNLPEGSPYVIKEDRKNSDLLFVGTEFGLFMSLNGGQSWQKFMNNLPTVAVHDLVVHPRDNDLIVGTHGRGIFILDDITPLQQMTSDVLSKNALLENRTVTRWLRIDQDQGDGWVGSNFYRGENPSGGGPINFYLSSDPSGEVTVEVSDITGKLKKTLTVEAKKGLNRVNWNTSFDMPELTDEEKEVRREVNKQDSDFSERIQAANKLSAMLRKRGIEMSPNTFFRFGRRGGGGARGPAASPGTYLVKLMVDGEEHVSKITLRNDPLLDEKR